MTSTKQFKSPISWFGGKYYQSEDIIKLFPKHTTYVEVFGGASHILFHKHSSEIEVYNDIDEGLYNFFKILRDKVKSEELVRLLNLTPYSRQEFYDCRDSWDKEDNDIERARKWYVSIMQSFSGNRSTWSFSVTISCKKWLKQ